MYTNGCMCTKKQWVSWICLHHTVAQTMLLNHNIQIATTFFPVELA